MSPGVKFLIGLAAALAAGLISHGPLGRGESFIDALEARAKHRIRTTGLPGIEVRMQRDPLRRRAILSGPADRFQREGQGSYPGINARIENIEGFSDLAWPNPPTGGR